MQHLFKGFCLVLVSGMFMGQAVAAGTLSDHIAQMTRKTTFPDVLLFAKENIIRKTFHFAPSPEEENEVPLGFRRENAVPHNKFFLRIDSLHGDEISGATHFTGRLSQSARGGEKSISGTWECTSWSESYFTIELNKQVNMEFLGEARSGFLGVTKNLRLQLVVNKKALLENKVAQVNLGESPMMHTFRVKQGLIHDSL